MELLAPVSLNIVCFRYRCQDADRVNARIVVDLQESGVAAPSTTRINGELAIRAAITNHRTAPFGYRCAGGGDARDRPRAARPGRTTESWRLRIVTDWRPAVERKEALREVEARLALDPDSIALCVSNELAC